MPSARATIASAVLLLAVCGVATASAAGADLNCTTLSAPVYDFYNVSNPCRADESVNQCFALYSSCMASASSCAATFACVDLRTRCLEDVAGDEVGSDCVEWVSFFNNEKMYFASGGEYAGSTLQLSCHQAVCDALAANAALECGTGMTSDVCVFEPSFDPDTPIPDDAVIVSMRITGNRTLFAQLLSTPAGRSRARVLVRIAIAQILSVARDKVVVTNLTVASLRVRFYVAGGGLSADEISSRLSAFAAAGNFSAFYDLADAAGIDRSELGLDEIAVSLNTPAPTAPATPNPVTIDESASCNSGCVAGVIVGVIAFVVILAVITVLVLRKPGDVGTGQREPVEDNSQHQV